MGHGSAGVIFIEVVNAAGVSILVPVALIDKRAGNANVLIDKALRKLVQEVNDINAGQSRAPTASLGTREGRLRSGGRGPARDVAP